MDLLLNSEFNNVRVPKATDKIYKDECIYSFRTPVSAHYPQIYKRALSWGWQESDEGLYVGLSSFIGLSRHYLTLHHRKTGERLYLLISRKEKVTELYRAFYLCVRNVYRVLMVSAYLNTGFSCLAGVWRTVLLLMCPTLLLRILFYQLTPPTLCSFNCIQNFVQLTTHTVSFK